VDHVATSIRAARQDAQMRLADVASKASCSVSLISMVESGYRPGAKAREQIGKALGASSGHFWKQDS
jgi:transcriptional regulator with XRE-family HTH domain